MSVLLRAAVMAALLATAACSNDGVSRTDGDSGEVTEASKVSVYQLQIGDCIDVPPDIDEAVETLPVAPCVELHTHEVYAIDSTTLAERYDLYPGAPDLEADANRVCFDEFDDYVGTEVVDSSLTFTFLYPTLRSWTDNDPGDRTVVCLAVGGRSTGSVAGTGA